MKRRFFVLSITLLACVYGVSQTLPSLCKVFLPRVLINRTIEYDKVKELGRNNNYGQTGGTTSKYWDVYSDRSENITYKSPSISSEKAGKLNFNQKVRIAEIQNGFALVYTENQAGKVNYPQISGDVKCLGWIPMDNLLLWSSCPTDQYGIYRKALIVRNLEHKGDALLGSISKDPDKSVEEVPLVANMDFHYIMKEIGSGEKTRYLIARANTLDGLTDAVLEGWVSRNSFSAWNQRSCLEPNWYEDDVDYFEKNNIKAVLYEKSDLSRETSSWSYGTKNKVGQLSTQYRMPPATMRFPILDNDSQDNNLFKATVFGLPNGNMGQIAITTDEVRHKFESELEDVSHINLIIVIDGTTSMGKYFTTMCNAVQKATDYLDKEAGYKVNVGAVIYRDYPDGNNKIEYHKVSSPDAASLQSFLKDIGRNGYGASSSKNDHTAHEALYLGLKTALDNEKMGYSPKNSNLIFIIGDCGNDPNDKTISEAELLALCKKNKAQLFSFQVANHDKQPWDDFNSQLTSLFKKHMDDLYSTMAKGSDKEGEIKVKWSMGNNRYSITTNSKEHYYMSEICRAKVGKELSEGELVSLIQENYKKIRRSIEEQKASISRGEIFLTDSIASNTMSIEAGFLKERLGDGYKAVAELNQYCAYEGYAKKTDEAGHDYWKAVVFLSSQELDDLIQKLDPIKIAVNTKSYSTKDRESYVKAVAGIIQSMTEKSADEIEQMTTEEVTRIIAGLNVSTPMLKGRQGAKVYTLSEIKNPIACQDADFKKILESMSEKINSLGQLKINTDFKYSYKRNNVMYYWIPLDMLP